MISEIRLMEEATFEHRLPIIPKLWG